MTINYIMSAGSNFKSDTSLVTNLYEAATQLGLNAINIDLLEEFSADELIQHITQAQTEQLYFFLVTSACNPTPKYSIDTLNRIWIAMKEKNQDSKFIVLANALNTVQADTVVDVFSSVYPIFMLAEHFWFTDERNYCSFIAESAHHEAANIELAKRAVKAKHIDLSQGFDEIFKAVSDFSAEDMIVVDTNLWYSELEILAAVRGMLPDHNIKLPAAEGGGLILNNDPDSSVYIHKDRTITICPTLILGQTELTTKSDLDYFESAIKSIFELQVDANKHSIEFVINWHQRRHFCLGIITFDIDRSGELAVIDSSKVLISVIDTKFRDSCVSQVKELLSPLLHQFSNEAKPLNIVTNPIYSNPQPDDNSCGVLVAELMLDFILKNKMKYSLCPVSKQQIKDFRIKHLKVMNCDKFVRLQHNKDALKHNKAKPTEGLIKVEPAVLVSSFSGYLQELGAESEDVKEFKMLSLLFLICDLNMQMHGADEANKPQIIKKLIAAQLMIDVKDEYVAFAAQDLDYDAAEQNARLYSGQLKLWFGLEAHETALRSETYGKFLNYIFKPLHDSDGDLEWESALEGKASLISVIEMLFDLQLVGKLEKIIKRQEEHRDEPIDYMYGAASLINVSDDGYSYAGSVNADSQAHGAGAEKIADIGYSYTGQFYNNRKVGDGVERHSINGTNLTLEFCGSRSIKGKYYTGAIVCILGTKLDTGQLIIFNGRLEQGKAHGNAVISVYYPDDKKIKLPLYVEIEDGEITVVLKHPNYSIKEEWEYDILHYASEHIGKMSLDLDPEFDHSLNIMRDLLTAKEPARPAKGFYPSGTLSARCKRNLTLELEQSNEPDSPHSQVSVSSGASGCAPKF